MTTDQRAALERLLEYVGRGFCAVQADCRMLREFLASLPRQLARMSDEPSGDRILIQVKGPPWEKPTVTYAAQKPSSKPKAKKPTPKTRKR